MYLLKRIRLCNVYAYAHLNGNLYVRSSKGHGHLRPNKQANPAREQPSNTSSKQRKIKKETNNYQTVKLARPQFKNGRQKKQTKQVKKEPQNKG